MNFFNVQARKCDGSSTPIFSFFFFHVTYFHLFPVFSLRFLFPSSPHLQLSAFFFLLLSFFFFFKVCERTITETSSFSAQAAKFILVVFCMFILGSLLGRPICGKTKRPGAGAFPLGIIEAEVKIGKSFFWGEMELRTGEHLPRVPFCKRRQKDHHSFFSYFVYPLSLSLLQERENVKTTISALF